MKKSAIIGFGRFGKLLAELSSNTFDVHVIEPDTAKAHIAQSLGYKVISLEDLASIDFIFISVPISKIEDILKIIGSKLNSSQVVVDLCSVKVFPTSLMRKYVTEAQIVGTHPMFGPDSARKGLAGAQVALCPMRISEPNLRVIRQMWEKHSIVTIETTPDRHDHDTAYSQAFTYSIAKLILNTEIPDVTFKTRSFKDISEVAQLSANDTDQLFHDMLFYNPYFKDMKYKLEGSIARTMNTLDTIAQEQETSEVLKSSIGGTAEMIMSNKS